jgi:hypothetical protein
MRGLQGMVQSMGGGAEGIGGALASMLGGGTPGSSPSNPVYTRDAQEGAVESPFGKMTSDLKDKVGSIFDDLSDNLSVALDFFADGFSDTMSGLFDGLSSLFSSGSGGGGWTSMLAGLFHSGGVVGSNAMRYHTGGIAGLQPDEVPAILRRGEEVLTEDNPRHRDNANSGGVASVTVNVNVESGETSAIADTANARRLGTQIASVVKQVIANEKRPGGLLG